MIDIDAQPGKPLRTYDENGSFRDYGTDDFIASGQNIFTGWKCAAGARNLSIEPDGRVFGASCEQDGLLGNIFEKIEFPKKWTTCGFAVCTCGADLFIPKVKVDGQKNLLRKTNGESTQILKRSGRLKNFVGIERIHSANHKQVYWELTHRCNYDCSYCTPVVHNKTDKFRPFADIMRATEKLNEDFAQGDKLNFIISGGEPTLHPHFMDWLRVLSTLGHHVSCHSNGSRLPDYYSELIKYCDLNLSLHFEFYRRERFLKVVEAVSKVKKERSNHNVGHLEIKVMMPPGGLEQAQSMEKQLNSIDGFLEMGGLVSVVPIRVGTSLEEVNPNYNSSEQEMFGAHT